MHTDRPKKLFNSALFAAAALAWAYPSICQSHNESVTKPPVAAQSVIDQAVKRAKVEKKTVFIHFSASW